MKAYLFFLIMISPLYTYASDINSCRDLVGMWETTPANHDYAMDITPSTESCGQNCVVLNVKYEINGAQQNKIFCHEGLEGVKGQGPMVMAFEGTYGGHVIGTYNRQLKALWAGVIPKDREGKWSLNMDSHWFKHVERSAQR